MLTIEKSLIVFKPDAVQRGIVGEILSRFEKVGLKIVGAKMLSPDTAFYHHHYEAIGTMITRHGQTWLVQLNQKLHFLAQFEVTTHI
jgi:nucleoside diphosphate kinase